MHWEKGLVSISASLGVAAPFWATWFAACSRSPQAEIETLLAKNGSDHYCRKEENG